jgi:uncharacterized repeat protein (TIGR02543 family)
MKKITIRSLCLLCAISMLLPLIVTTVNAYSISDWTLSSNTPAGAEIIDRKWTYTKTTYVSSTSTSMSGYSCSGSEWVLNGSGSATYADIDPSFDSNNGYVSFNASCPFTAYENATNKRAVSTSWAGYVYWHWMYPMANNTQYDTNTYGLQRKFSLTYTSYYSLFNYVMSTVDCPIAAKTGFCINDSTCAGYDCYNIWDSWRVNDGQRRFYRFNYYNAYYSDYYKLFHYYKVENLESASELSESSSSAVVINNIKEYVKYKNSFTVTYDANGGTDAPADQTKNYGAVLMLSASVPTRDGYRFLGWSVSPNALAASYLPGSNFTVNGDTTLYAVWQSKTSHVVTYDCRTNGGTQCTMQKAAVYDQESADLSPTAVKNGWSFVGWNPDPAATTAVSNYTVSSDVTLYAIYSKTVTASIYAGANILQTEVKKTLYNNETAAAVTLPQISAYADWTQLCWVSGEDRKTYQEGTAASISEDTVFYAKYSKNLTLSYDANGGNTTPPAQSVVLFYTADGKYDENDPILADAIERGGYNFSKWALGSASGPAYGAGDTVHLTGSTVMYALWTELPVTESPIIEISETMTGKDVHISCNDKNAAIYYTLDGSSPTAKSAKYIDAVLLSSAGNYTIKAVAVSSGCTDSAIAIKNVTVTQAEKPSAGPESGFVHAGVQISLQSGVENAVIYYTMDGSAPTQTSDVYTEPLSMDHDFILKAVAACSGCVPSECVSYTYKLAPEYTTGTYGYSFPNAASSFGYTNTAPSFLHYCIPYSSVKLIYGDSVKGKSVYTSIANYQWGGNCCGMASTSALLFSNSVDIKASSFTRDSVNALTVNDISQAYEAMPVRMFIEAMQTSQYSVQFSRDYKNNKKSSAALQKGDTLDSLYNTVKSDLAQDKNDIIAIGKSGVGAHALLAYAIQDVSETESRLYIYDCNYPNDANRYFTLQKNSAGNIISWSYTMGRLGTWGSDISAGSCYISFIPFDTISYIWNNRGHLFNNYLTLTIADENAAICDLDGNEVGKFVNGEFYSEKSDVFAVPNIALSNESDQSVYLPEDFYVVTNLDGGELKASMVGDSLGASVTTSADTVCFGIDESLHYNNVSIEQAGTNDSCTITLDSCSVGAGHSTAFKNVTISGTGTGDTLTLSSSGSNLSASNCNIDSYKINGIEQISYVITASSGNGGTITPTGDISVSAASDKTFKIDPEAGYQIKDVLVDGYSIGAETEYTFENIGKNHVIHASFESAYSVNNVSISGSNVTIGFTNSGAVNLLVAIYDAGGRMIAIRSMPEPSNAARGTVSFETLPEAGKIKVFLLSQDTSQPLCKSSIFSYGH